MSSEIGTIPGGHNGPFFYNDPPLRGKALPNSGSIESEPFDLANTQGALKVMLFADTGFTVPDGKKLTVELLGSDAEDGEYTAYKSFTATGAATTGTKVEAGEETPIAAFIPDQDAPKYGKLKITADADLSAGVVTARIGYIAR